MWYCINVARNGKHVFATAQRSLMIREDAEALFKLLRKKFPEEDGYELTLTRWTQQGETIKKD
jgi:hypothetical protein